MAPKHKTLSLPLPEDLTSETESGIRERTKARINALMEGALIPMDVNVLKDNYPPIPDVNENTRNTIVKYASLLTAGLLPSIALQKLGVTSKQIDDLCKANEVVCEIVTNAERLLAQKLVDETLIIADSTTWADSSQDKMRIEARRWYAAKLDQRWGDKQKLEVEQQIQIIPAISVTMSGQKK